MGGTTTLHDNGGRQHDDGKGQQGGTTTGITMTRHDDGDRRHDDGDGRHVDGDGRHDNAAQLHNATTPRGSRATGSMMHNTTKML